MLRWVKDYSSLALVFVLISTILVACQSVPPENQVKTTTCKKQISPTVTRLNELHGSSQMIYVGSNTHVYALNAGSGLLHWCIDFIALSKGAGVGSLTLNRDGLYAATMDGEIVALNALTGSFRWNYEADVPADSPSPIVNDALYGGGYRTIYAFNAQNGVIQWKYFLEKDKNYIRTAPVVKDKALYFGAVNGTLQARQSQLYALDVTKGSLLWLDHWDNPNDFFVSPPIVEQGVVCVNLGQRVLGIDTQNGKVLWQQERNVIEPLEGSGDLLYLTENNVLYALDIHSGNVRWSIPLEQGSTRILVHDSVLYVNISSALGMIEALTSSDGSILWKTRLQMGAGAVLTRSALLDEELYVGTYEDGRPYLLHALNAQSGTEDWYTRFSERSSSDSMLDLTA